MKVLKGTFKAGFLFSDTTGSTQGTGTHTHPSPSQQANLLLIELGRITITDTFSS